MKENNVIQEKSLTFAVIVVILCKYLREKQKDYIISKQLLRSGTSIGANLEEGLGSQSKKDFYYRLSISYKEARESIYWLKILKESKMVDNEMIEKPMLICEEILKILGSIMKTIRTQQSLQDS